MRTGKYWMVEIINIKDRKVHHHEARKASDSKTYHQEMHKKGYGEAGK